MGHHSHGPHRFSFDKVDKLDNDERKRRQPASAVVDALDLRSRDRVLDLGAGTGYFALPIAERLESLGEGGRVYALDLEPRMLDLLEKRAAAAGLARWIERVALPDDGPALPLKDGSVTRALMANLFHELPDPDATLREIGRALEPGGVLLLVDWDPAGSPDFGPSADHRIPREVVEQALGRNEFERVTGIELYDDLYALRAVRRANVSE